VGKVHARNRRYATSTIRRRLAALPSLFKHLVCHQHATENPVADVERPTINRDEGSTLAFSKAQASKRFDATAAISALMLMQNLIEYDLLRNAGIRFAASPDLPKAILNTIINIFDAHTEMSNQALNSESAEQELRDIMVGQQSCMECFGGKCELRGNHR